MNRREALKHTSLILGYTISSSTIAGILSSCKSEPALDWQPAFFTADQAQLVTEMAERILPKTNTPGAKDLRLGQFVDKMIKAVFSPEDQQKLLAGLRDFEKVCQDTYQKSFVDCTAEQQEAMLLKFEKLSPKQVSSIWGFPTDPIEQPVSFYRTLKSLTLLGYFSSEEVGKNVLSYDPVPGVYQSCMPVSEIGNCWTE